MNKLNGMVKRALRAMWYGVRVVGAILFSLVCMIAFAIAAMNDAREAQKIRA